jgi:hypothetical protein
MFDVATVETPVGEKFQDGGRGFLDRATRDIELRPVEPGAQSPRKSDFIGDTPYRKELKRSHLTGTNMEVITSIQEMKPEDVGFLHIHHGEEAYYFIEGGMVETPDGKQIPLFETGPWWV